ncbi:hypothetical protein ACVBEH_09800 [Roseateles sp. GG27B]
MAQQGGQLVQRQALAAQLGQRALGAAQLLRVVQPGNAALAHQSQRLLAQGDLLAQQVVFANSRASEK